MLIMQINFLQKQLKESNIPISSHQQQFHILNQATKDFNLFPSQYYLTKYLPILQDIQCPKLELIKAQLKKNQLIQWCQEPQQKLQKHIIITNWQTTMYEIKIGHLKGYLTILNFFQDSNKFTPKMLKKGQYGSISDFKFNKQHYALKNIKFDAQNLQKFDAGLLELFLLKVASCLQIGPSFYNLFGYDGILYDDCLQFCMQFCSDSYSKALIEEQILSKNLYKGLKILHSLKICHCDIKMENVAFSSKHNKFVFLDFGFSSFNKEDIGFKTLTSFKGTFSYCSQEMRKNYFLRTTSFVDLYYNDLHCLIKTLQILEITSYNIDKQLEVQYIQISQGLSKLSGFSQISAMRDSIFQPISFDKHRGQAEQIQEYECLLRFFQLKKLIFNNELSEIQKMCLAQKKLILSFRRIIFQIKQSLVSIGYNIFQILYKSYDEVNKNIKNNYKIDIILYNYLVRVQNEGSNYLWWKRMHNMKEMCLQKDLLVHIWGNENWMLEIFYFIDVNHMQLAGDVKRRTFFIQLYDFIYENVPRNRNYSFIRQKSGKRQRNFTIMYRHIMIVLFEYFLEKQNIFILQKIIIYFVFFDEINKEMAEKQLMKIYLKKNRFLGYFAKNIEFFLCKNLGFNFEPIIGENNHKKNLLQLKNQLSQSIKINPNSQYQHLISLINLGVKIIKMVIVRSDDLAQFFKLILEIELQLLYFQCEGELKDDIRNILCIFMGYHPNMKVNYFSDYKIKIKRVNKFLISYINQNLNDSFSSVEKKLTFQAAFYQKYFHFCQYRPMILENFLKNLDSILVDMKEMWSFDSFVISQFLFQFIWEAMRQGHVKHNTILKEIFSFPLQKISNFKDLYLLLSGMTKIVRAFYQKQSVKNGSYFLTHHFFYGQGKKYLHEMEEKLKVFEQQVVALVLTVCRWSQKILQTHNKTQILQVQQVPYQQEIEQQQQQDYREKLQSYISFLRSSVYFIKQQYQKAIQQISKLKKIQYYSNGILYVSLLYDVTAQKKSPSNQKIGLLIMKIYKGIQSMEFLIQIKNSSLFIKAVICDLIKKNKKIEAMNTAIHFMKCQSTIKGYAYKYEVNPILFLLRDACDHEMQKLFIKVVNQTSMQKMSEKPGLCMFFFIFLMREINQNIPFSVQFLLRTVILCVFGFQYLPNCSFSMEKVIIKYLMLKIPKLKKKLIPREQILYKSYNNNNVISKLMKKLEKTKIPHASYFSIEKNLKNISKNSYDYYKEI